MTRAGSSFETVVLILIDSFDCDHSALFRNKKKKNINVLENKFFYIILSHYTTIWHRKN